MKEIVRQTVSVKALACKRTGLATSCVFECHIARTSSHLRSASCIFESASHLRTRVASSNLHISDPHISGFSYLTSSYPHMVASQIFVSYIVASASHLRAFASQILTSQIFISYIFTFIFRCSYFANRILSSHFPVFMTWSHCPILSSSRFHYHILTT